MRAKAIPDRAKAEPPMEIPLKPIAIGMLINKTFFVLFRLVFSLINILKPAIEINGYNTILAPAKTALGTEAIAAWT